MNICIISGSARTNNNTLRVAKAIQQHLQGAQHQVSLVDFQQYDIPLINQGEVSAELFTPFQQNLANCAQAAQAVIIITPEYNWSTTPEILNWLHRFGDKKIGLPYIGMGLAGGKKEVIIPMIEYFAKSISAKGGTVTLVEFS